MRDLSRQFHGGYDGKDPRPMLPHAKPEPGEEYVDGAFGTRVTRVTGAKAWDGENAIIKPMYSTMPAWSPDERYLLLWDRARGHQLYQGDRPYRLIGPLGAYHPTDIESVCWSPVAPHPDRYYELYYPSNYDAMPWYIRHRFRPGRSAYISLQQDFTQRPTRFPAGDWSRLLSLGGDPQAISRGPALKAGLRFGPTSGYEPACTFTYSIDDDESSALMDLDPVYQNAFIPSPSERWAQFGRMVCTPRLYLRRVLRLDPYEHACPGLSDEGDVWNMIDFDTPDREGSLVSYRLDTGEGRVIVGPATGYPYPPPGTHISSVGPPDLVAVGIVGSGQGQTLLDNELVLADVTTGQVLRVAHLRTLADEGPWGYWAESHCVISPSGTRILWASDWGGSDTVDTYVVDLRMDRPDELPEEDAAGVAHEYEPCLLEGAAAPARSRCITETRATQRRRPAKV